ncbi:iron complex outermembrane receptor protein [Oxalobacteraceae bacterium GrIS 2.11]
MMMETTMSRSVRLVFASGAAIGIGMLAQPALAQQADTAPAASVQRVEITGSSIRRVDAETPSPVQVISSEDLKKSGYTSISQVLTNITANGQGTLSQGFAGAFAGGASGISLRGLNTSATLVLIDGHRMAPNALSDDGQRSFVDVSNIPFDTIERIEILKDGASAVYGSDAMAGVVNVILKKSMVGTVVNAEGGSSTKGGGATVHASVTSGFGDLDADGFNAYGSLEYRHQNAVTNASRFSNSPGGWAALDWTPFGGQDFTPGTTAQTPHPRIPGSPYLRDPNAPFSAANAVFLGGTCNYALLTSNACAYKPEGNVSPPTENINLLGSFTKRLSDGWQIGIKGSIFEEKVTVYRRAHTRLLGGNSWDQNVAVSAGVSPYLAGVTLDSVTVPANYPGNTLGVPAIIYGFDGSSPPNEDKVNSKNYRLVADLTGSIGEWDTQTSLGFTENSIKDTTYGSLYAPALQDALNRATNPYSLTGPNSAADQALIYPNVSATDKSKLSFVEFHATRSLMTLAGGDLGFSTGASYIAREMNSPAPTLIANGTLPGNNAYVSGKQTDAALFAEIAAPITKTFELDGAVRYDHFGQDGSNNSFTPKAGFKWTPSTTFALRGTFATGFRAPNPAEAGQAGQAYVGSGWDLVNCPGGPAAVTITDPVTGKPKKVPAAGSYINACQVQPTVLNASNQGTTPGIPALKPEKSKSATLGLILEPIKGWSSTFDLYAIKINDQIITPSNVDQANAVRNPNAVSGDCADGAGGTVPCTLTGGAKTGEILYIPNEYINANSTKTSGWELETHYKWKLGDYGTLLTSLDWSHTMSYILTTGGTEFQLAGTHGPSIIGGNTGNPKDRAQFTVTYDKGPWDVTATANWVSDYLVYDPSYQGATDCETSLQAVQGLPFFPNGDAPKNYCKVGSFMTTDLTVRYKISKQLVVHFAANNLFNRKPPVDLSTYGGNTPFNPSLHQSGAIGTFLQAGVTYNF